MVLVQKWPFFLTFFFLGKIDQENVFYDILERKNAFLDYNLKKFKKSKNWHFCKGLTHGFGPKMAIFPTIFFRQYRPGKCLLRYSRTKNAFLGRYKNKTFKKSKNWHFCKGVNPCFRSKNGHFSICSFLKQYRPGKCLLRCSRTKKCLSRLSKHEA